jgi:DNA-binding winged helix-turn-helix (wHTH) protein
LRLRRGDEVLQLAPKAVDLLLVLVQKAGQVLSTDDLLKIVRADCVVEPSNLHAQIANLRKAIGKEFIKTVPKAGVSVYRCS